MTMQTGDTGVEPAPITRITDMAPGGDQPAPLLPGLGADLPAGGGAAGPRRRMHSGLLVMTLVLVVAGGALFVMRKMGLRGGLKFVDVEIDYPVDEAGPRVRDNKHVQVMNDLKAGEAVVQVPLQDLQRNPFELGMEKATTLPMSDPGLSEAERIRREREDRQRLITASLSTLSLNSVLTGSVPLARISGNAYRVGDSVGGIFIVRAIHGRKVDLEADGVLYSLSMGE